MGKLLIYDATAEGFRETSEAYAELIMRCDPKPCVYGVKSWDDFYKRLAQYKSIEVLVLAFHGERGVLQISNTPKSLVQIEKEMLRHRPPIVTRRVHLEACSVAEEATSLLALQRTFKTPIVSAYNYYYTSLPDKIRIYENTTSKQIEETLAPCSDFLLRGTTENLKRKKARPKPYTYIIEWFANDPLKRDPPCGNRRQKNKIMSLSQSYRKRIDAQPKEVTTFEELQKLQNEYFIGFPFHEVILKMPQNP